MACETRFSTKQRVARGKMRFGCGERPHTLRADDGAAITDNVLTGSREKRNGKCLRCRPLALAVHYLKLFGLEIPGS